MFVLLATTLFAFVFAALSPLLRHAPLILAAAVDWSPVVKAALAAAQAVITLLVPILGALLAQWLRSKLKTDKARELFDRVQQFAATEVRALAQSTLPEVRAAMEDGKITQDEAKRLRGLVIDKVRLTLGNDGLAALRALLGDRDVDSYLASVIESEVLRVKTDAPRSIESIAAPLLSTASGEVLR